MAGRWTDPLPVQCGDPTAPLEDRWVACRRPVAFVGLVACLAPEGLWMDHLLVPCVVLALAEDRLSGQWVALAACVALAVCVCRAGCAALAACVDQAACLGLEARWTDHLRGWADLVAVAGAGETPKSERQRQFVPASAKVATLKTGQKRSDSGC